MEGLDVGCEKERSDYDAFSARRVVDVAAWTLKQSAWIYVVWFRVRLGGID